MTRVGHLSLFCSDTHLLPTGDHPRSCRRAAGVPRPGPPSAPPPVGRCSTDPEREGCPSARRSGPLPGVGQREMIATLRPVRALPAWSSRLGAGSALSAAVVHLACPLLPVLHLAQRLGMRRGWQGLGGSQLSKPRRIARDPYCPPRDARLTRCPPTRPGGLTRSRQSATHVVAAAAELDTVRASCSSRRESSLALRGADARPGGQHLAHWPIASDKAARHDRPAVLTPGVKGCSRPGLWGAYRGREWPPWRRDR